MELRSGRRLRSSERLGPSGGGGEDLISTLPDDLLVLVLARLPCAGAAARTGVLSRRWRGLWARLRRIVLRDVPFHSLEPALARVPRPPPAVSLLEIQLPKRRGRVPKEQLVNRDRLGSVLRAVALLDPEEFILVVPSCLVDSCLVVDLICLHRATSIVLDLILGPYLTIVCIPAALEFPALEMLSLSRCLIDFDALLPCCPRLRTLRLADIWFAEGVLSVKLPLLQELVVVRTRSSINHVNIVAPVLTQLTISVHTNPKVDISILAPMMEKVSWDCYFSMDSSVFGLWRLVQLSLQAVERRGQPPSLQIHAYISPTFYHDEADSFTRDIEKQLIAAFSVLELNLEVKGHVYGAFVSHVLEINQIRCAIQRLKVDIQRSVMDEELCLPDCPCEPTDWKSQTISLTALEEVEINGFEGEDHELDLLKLILRCAPMLKRMVMKLS
uniref:Uncharacterized protein n=4 Tax=Avena sativa TaxID=4498 RepID=A0ACD5UK13_AVESA